MALPTDSMTHRPVEHTGAAADTAADKQALSNQVGDMARIGAVAGAAAGTAGKTETAHATTQEVHAGHLPALTIENSAKPHHWYDGALAVTEDVAKGAWNEVTHHPLHVAESFAIGAGVAAAATLVAPEVATVAAVAGLTYGAVQIGMHASSWLHSARDVANPEGKSAEEMKKAHEVLQGFGAGATDIAAGVAGGFVGRAAALAVESAMNGSGAAAAKAAAGAPENQAAEGEGTNTSGGNSNNTGAPRGDSHAVKTATGASSTSTGDNGSSAAAATPNDGGASGHAGAVHAHHAIAGGAMGGDPSSESGAGAAAVESAGTKAAAESVGTKTAGDAAAGAMTPEETALANSVRNSQGIFEAANNNSGAGVVESTKQLYNVRFEKVTEEAGRRLFTLENRTEGVVVPKGAYIATRLDAAGQPVIEDGMTNSWSMQAPKIAKTYNVDPATLEGSGDFVAPTRVDGPSVHMVQLEKPTTIMTKWGQMEGKIGDWLANYDFDKATGKAGSDYAIVSGPSYKQTYQPKVSS